MIRKIYIPFLLSVGILVLASCTQRANDHARTYYEQGRALREKGEKVGLFRPVTVWPFPEKQLREKCAHVRRLLVVEHNHGQMLLEVQRAAAGALPVDFLGRIDGTVISPADILAKLSEMEGKNHAE